MNRQDFELLGDKHKAYEARFVEKLMPGLPIILRLDGRSFHTFTKGLDRPYDIRMSTCMMETAKYLVDQTQANVSYVQSDEITLGFLNNDTSKDILFGGRTAKLLSIVASIASVKFNQQVALELSNRTHMLPVFDARVFQYPTLDLAAENFLWRETDATRNSLTMAAHSVYNHSNLQKIGAAKKHDMLMEKGINWNDYPAFFKRGTYFGKRVISKYLTPDEQAKIPEKYRPVGPVNRSIVTALNLKPFTTMVNPVEVLFFNCDPIYYE